MWLSVWVRCRFAYGPVNATATHCLVRLVLPFWLTWVVPVKGSLNRRCFGLKLPIHTPKIGFFRFNLQNGEINQWNLRKAHPCMKRLHIRYRSGSRDLLGFGKISHNIPKTVQDRDQAVPQRLQMFLFVVAVVYCLVLLCWV